MALEQRPVGYRLMRWSVTACTAALLLVVIAWLTGELASDRWPWSQYLEWIPTPVAIAFLTLACVIRLFIGASRQASRWPWWCGALLAVVAYFGLIEHRLLGRWSDVEGRDGVRFVHWNVATDDGSTPQQIADAITHIAGDVTIISHGGHAPYQPVVMERLGPAMRITRILVFDVISALPVIRADIVLATGGVSIAVVELDASGTALHGGDGTLRIMLVDLPSKLRVPRMQTAQQVRGLLETLQTPRPDIIVGDFNITRGSAAMRALFPWNEFDHAYDQHGRGYAASFPRALPLWHIDHTLVGPGLECIEYQLVDPGLTRHRAQVMTIRSSQH